MSVIGAVRDQWNRAECAIALNNYLKDKPDTDHFFIGATTLSTVSNLIAALIGQANRQVLQEETLNDERFFLILFDCFLLLFVKEAQNVDLTQPEQIIQSLSLHYAIKLNDGEINSNQSTALKCEQVILTSNQLTTLRKQRRHQHQNMGRN